MRIITGTAKGIKLESLSGTATMPTSERVKEAIFSMLQFELEGKKVLDLFGGSGQMALEALSRGSAFALINDSSKEATEIIRRNAIKTKFFDKVKITTQNFEDLIKRISGEHTFDIVFLDPPYKSALYGIAIKLLFERNLLNDNAIIVCESDMQNPLEIQNLNLRKHNKYGKTYVTIYNYLPAQQTEN